MGARIAVCNCSKAPFHNPFRIDGQNDRLAVVKLFQDHFLKSASLKKQAIDQLQVAMATC